MAQWVRIRPLASFSGFKDPVLLWLWCWPAAAAPIGPLAWELPHAAGVSLKKQKKKEKKENDGCHTSSASLGDRHSTVLSL